MDTLQNLSINRKFESVCLYGHDLTMKKVLFKDYVLSMSGIISLLRNIQHTRSLHHNQFENTNENFLHECKVILRAAMYSVALKLNKYSRDLYYCCKFYEDYYPH